MLASFAAVSYGLVNVFINWYIDFPYLDMPFPFGTHYQEITPHPDGVGMIVVTSSDPVASAQGDPVWLLWSFSLYGGIAIAATTMLVRPAAVVQGS